MASTRRQQRVYETPRDAFAATFIGGFSLLPGIGKDGGFRVAGRDGALLRTANCLAGEARLVVRPEDARPAATFPDNKLNGQVLSRAFQGRCWRLSVAVGEHKLRLDWPEGPAEGAAIAFSLPPERCVLVAD